MSCPLTVRSTAPALPSVKTILVSAWKSRLLPGGEDALEQLGAAHAVGDRDPGGLRRDRHDDVDTGIRRQVGCCRRSRRRRGLARRDGRNDGCATGLGDGLSRVLARALDEVDAEQDGDDAGGDHRVEGPVRPGAGPEGTARDRRRREALDRDRSGRGGALLVLEGGEEGCGVDTDRGSHRLDVPARVHVAAAAAEVVGLDLTEQPGTHPRDAGDVLRRSAWRQLWLQQARLRRTLLRV